MALSATPERTGKAGSTKAHQIDAGQILARQGEPYVRTQVVGQLFDKEITYRASHLQGDMQMVGNFLISMVKSENHQSEVTNLGYLDESKLHSVKTGASEGSTRTVSARASKQRAGGYPG